MAVLPRWYAIATDARVLRRALITSLGVGTVLTVVNRWDEIFNGAMAAESAVPIVITYVVPFAVSLGSSVIALRVERRDTSAASALLEREIQAINKFPDQNPNPVLRMSERGRMTYANPASAIALAGLGVSVGGTLEPALAARLRDAAAEHPPRVVEIEHEGRTLAILAVHVPELAVYNLYGTDVTAAKAVERFPDRNPNPVLRMTPDGELRYANAASAPILRALGTEVGGRIPAEVLAALQRALEDPGVTGAEVAGEGRTYRLDPVSIPEFGVVNVYGTDITATVAINKFPNQNPNPVLRFDRGGRLTYANPASAEVRRALGVEVGETLARDLFTRFLAAAEDPGMPTIEVEAEGRQFELLVVSVYEFNSINVYGTDVTAAKAVARYSAENERLLLSILPRSIAARLRAGETVIADRFDDMAVLFADVVGFTAISARLPADDVVALLNEVFTMCDQIADRFHLEKIKTIGDAYMVVGGIEHEHDEPDGSTSVVPHAYAADVADMALAMISGLADYRSTSGVEVAVRVGMHVGPAVAGVIGLRKFIYDVWGDTVNTASRMESTGVPGRIQVTRETVDRLGHLFEFERRGVVDIKGKGATETWFLVGRRAPALEA